LGLLILAAEYILKIDEIWWVFGIALLFVGLIGFFYIGTEDMNAEAKKRRKTGLKELKRNLRS